MPIRLPAMDSFVPRDRILFEPDMRHCAVWVEGNTLHVLWSRVGDAPESILYSRVRYCPPGTGMTGGYRGSGSHAARATLGGQ